MPNPDACSLLEYHQAKLAQLKHAREVACVLANQEYPSPRAERFYSHACQVAWEYEKWLAAGMPDSKTYFENR